LEEVLDAAKLHQTIDQVDLSQPDQKKLISDIKALLKDKAELDDNQIAQPQFIKQLEIEYGKKMKELQLKEEQFNQCVVIIPESDENAIRLTTEIQQIKNNLDTRCLQLKTVRDDLKHVGD